MAKFNLKLLQGVELEEQEIQKERQISDALQDNPVGKKEETREEFGGKAASPNSSKKVSANSKRTESEKSGAKSRKAGEKSDKNCKQVFSFRAAQDNIYRWKCYALASEQTMEKMASNALNEYMTRHKLSNAEQIIFDALIGREKQ